MRWGKLCFFVAVFCTTLVMQSMCPRQLSVRPLEMWQWCDARMHAHTLTHTHTHTHIHPYTLSMTLKCFVSLHWVIDLPVVSLCTVKLYPMINILFPPIATETLNCILHYHRRVWWLPTWETEIPLLAPSADPLPWPGARPTATLQRNSLQDTSQGGDDHWDPRGPIQSQCLCRFRVIPERASDIIVACVILHNIATIRGEQCPALSPDDPDDNPNPPADARDGGAVRDMICFNHF